MTIDVFGAIWQLYAADPGEVAAMSHQFMSLLMMLRAKHEEHTAAKSAAKIRGLQRESISIEREYEQWNNQMSGMCSGRKAQRKSLSASEPPATTPMKLAFNAVGQRMQNATTRLCNDSSLSFYPFEIQEGMQSVRDALSATSLGLDVHKLRDKVRDARRTLAAQAEEGGASPSKSMKAKIGALRTKIGEMQQLDTPVSAAQKIKQRREMQYASDKVSQLVNSLNQEYKISA